MVCSGVIPMVPIAQAHVTYLATAVIPNVWRTLGDNAFIRPLLGLVMIGIENERLLKFLKLKPPVLQGSQSEDAYYFVSGLL